MASILIDDTHPQIQYLPSENWTPQQIDAEDILVFPSLGLTSPMYGTQHASNNTGNDGAPVNTSLAFNYTGTKYDSENIAKSSSALNWYGCAITGTNFSAHLRTSVLSTSEDVICELDGQPQSVQIVSGIFLCSSNSTPSDGPHRLNVIVMTTRYYFDYLKYTPSASLSLQDNEDVMFGEDNGTIVELVNPGTSTSFLFDGYSTGLYTLFDDGFTSVPKEYDMMYVVDNQPPVFFTFSQPIFATNTLGEPQLLLQTANLGPGIHNLTLQWLPPARENQTTVRIQSYVVQNSTSSIDLGIFAIPVSSTTVGSGGGAGKRVGVIVGCTIGGIVLALLAIAILLAVLRHRRRKRTRMSKAGLYLMHRLGPEQPAVPAGERIEFSQNSFSNWDKPAFSPTSAK